jgi:hypothetical protein
MAHIPLNRPWVMKTVDVVVEIKKEIVLFTPQNRDAAQWLYEKCNSEMDHFDEPIGVHPATRDRLMHALKTAGFSVRVC